MNERKGTKGLELWCRKLTEGYPGVKVVNMTTSWRDGLAFCAIIHHFRPDLIEFSKLNKDDIYHNNELAFRVAERHLGIPALLEPEDMVEFPVPDRLSILTYLSQFYQAFVVSQGKSPPRITTKRPASTQEHSLVSPGSSSPPTKTLSAPVVGKIRREPCAKCGLPVFIAERLNVGKHLYHRTCFRCARCDAQLTLADYYETENGDFCCETCPDEEKSITHEESVLSRSLSDEEKSKSLQNTLETDEYSAEFETALEFPKDDSLKRDSTLGTSQYSKARSFFIGSQVGDSDSGNEEPPPPDLPKSGPPKLNEVTFSDSGFPAKDAKDVNIGRSVSVLESRDIVTKDTISAEGETKSLVKARMRLFEAKSDVSNEKEHSFDDGNKNEESIITISDTTDVIEISDDSILKEHDQSEDTVEEIDIKPLLPDDSILQETIEPEKNVQEVKQSPPSPIIEISDDSILKESEQSEQIVQDTNDEALIHDHEVKQSPVSSPVMEISDDSLLHQESNSSKDQSSAIEDSKEYPDDLNPFGEDDEEPKKNESLNPFDEEEGQVVASPKPVARKRIKPFDHDKASPVPIERISLNPFDEEEEDEEEFKKPKPEPIKRKVIAAPKISLTPFWCDDEEEGKPIPKPRSNRGPGTEEKPRESVSSTSSAGSTLRKKKPAPRPPIFGGESGASSLTSSPSHSVTHSPRATPKLRKSKKAPLPPTSTPNDLAEHEPVNFSLGDDFEPEKIVKDEQNRNRQSQSLIEPNKSTYGKWKRKKGQAPSRPIPQRRQIKELPIVEVKKELELIETQQQGLERQGVRLEQMIRDKSEGPEATPDDVLPAEVEDMVLQLFELVNEKNELFRRQAELMYLRRQQKLEEEHADLEYQIRCLMLQPEVNKTDSDKAREEELINRLVEVVERRNAIIECLEMDRVREAEEDDSISNQLTLYTMKKEDEKQEHKTHKKVKKKFKKLKLKVHKLDADKDIDESEGSSSVVKEKKKKKFNLF